MALSKKLHTLCMVAAIGCVVLVGCEFNALKIEKEAKKVAADTPAYSEAVDGVASAVESVAGPIPANVAEKGQSAAEATETVAGTIAEAAPIVKALTPEKYRPFIDAGHAVLGAVAGIAGAAAAFFRKRNKQTERAAKTMVKALDDVSGGGKTVTSLAEDLGTEKEVRDVYLSTRGV